MRPREGSSASARSIAQGGGCAIHATDMRLRSGLVLFVLVTASAVSATRAARAEPSSTDRAVAQTLFDEGRVLMGQGNYAEACPRFARSQMLDPGAGTVLNLALCHEGEGKLATAWTEFNEALSQAKRDHREDREKLAREHVDALGPRVPRVNLHVEETSAELELRIDDVRLDRGAWDAPIPIDPGDHVITASAVGKRTWTGGARLAIGETADVVVPALADAAPRKDSGTSPTASETSEGHGTLGWVLIGSGAAAAAVGAYLGVRALGAKSDSDDLCPTSTCNDPEAVTLSKDAVTLGWGANVSIGVGLVAIAIGTYLVLTAPSSQAASTATRLRVSPLLRGGSFALAF